MISPDAPIPTAPLDPMLCRTMANVVRRLDLTFDDKERIAEQLTAAADLAGKYERDTVALHRDLCAERNATRAHLAERPTLTEERVREVVSAALEDLTDRDGVGVHRARVAERIAKELAGAVVDPAQREADLREAVLYGARWQDPLLTGDSPELMQAAAEYAHSKAGG